MHSSRICAIQITIGSTDILVFNIYMPCDTGANNGLYSDILHEIMAKCVELGSTNIILGGDLNTNLQRTNSDFNRQMKLMCDADNFTPCIDFVDSNIKYTFTNPVDHGTHIIDHFHINDGSFYTVLDYYSLHDGSNLSFHSPIIITLLINIDYSICAPKKHLPKPKWQESTEQELSDYANTLDGHLSNVSVPWEAVKCVNKSCTVNKQHCREIKQFHDSIISSCVEAGKQCIAYTSRPSKTRGLTGWNEIVRPYRDDSLFWNSVWRQCGSPRDAVVADVMRRARSQYHNAVRLLGRDQLNTQKDRVAQALLADQKINFWKEIRKMKGKNDTLPTVVDGINKEGDISELFASQYDDLYNSVSYDSESMVVLSNRLDRLIHDTPNVGNHINVNDVKRGIDQLKPNKKRRAWHLIHGPFYQFK